MNEMKINRSTNVIKMWRIKWAKKAFDIILLKIRYMVHQVLRESTAACHQCSNDNRCFLKDSSGISRGKNILGPKMEPCGAPQMKGAEEDETLS